MSINLNKYHKNLMKDFKEYLGIDESDIKGMNYAKTKDYLLKLFERVGNMIKSIKDEPYSIKNCLYFLSKVEVFPGYRQQADELEEHIKELIKLHPTVDMETILNRQLTNINAKKYTLAEKTDEKEKGKILSSFSIMSILSYSLLLVGVRLYFTIDSTF